MRRSYTGTNPRIVIRVSPKELRDWNIAAEQRNVYMQTVGYEMFKQWYRAGAPADIKDIRYTDPKEAYCMHVIHTDPSELSEAEALLQTLIDKVFLLKQDEKNDKVKGKNRNGSSLQYAG